VKLLSISALAAMVALVCGSAYAADMPVKAPPAAPPPPTWTGTYIGLNAGYGRGTSRQSVFNDPTATTGDYDIRGGLAGVTFGGNWQGGHVVLGFESDVDWAHINRDFQTPVCAAGICFTHTKWLSTERLRAGWDLNGWLLYGTLGAAFGRVQAGQTGACVIGTLCGENTRAGWTAGVGVETMFWRNWSAKLEYLHYDLGEHFQYNPGSQIIVLDRGDIVRGGINYHFDLFSLVR
jgi:outer membrane immunogenic protein